MQHLDFEQQVHALDQKIGELQHMTSHNGLNIMQDISSLQRKRDRLLKTIYEKLTPWQVVQVARHPERPHYRHLLNELVKDFVPLAGDRVFGDDPAIVGGLGSFRGVSAVFIGQEKGHDTETRMRHNFGMPRPEGYRKAQRLMKLADHYQLPVLTVVDTSGAYPGLDAEERGQAEAIARSMDVSLGLKVPVVTLVLGEGGSGGAIAIAASNAVLMMEYAVYSVISPEGCASILWRNADMKKHAAAAQKLTAQDLMRLKIIDQIVPEPLGGAHRDHKSAIGTIGDILENTLTTIQKMRGDELYYQRRNKFLKMGQGLC